MLAQTAPTLIWKHLLDYENRCNNTLINCCRYYISLTEPKLSYLLSQVDERFHSIIIVKGNYNFRHFQSGWSITIQVLNFMNWYLIDLNLHVNISLVQAFVSRTEGATLVKAGNWMAMKCRKLIEWTISSLILSLLTIKKELIRP